MDKKVFSPKVVDEYISKYPPEVRAKLERIRREILSVAPEATQRISYGMPAFELDGPLAYFAVFERHIGFYPLPKTIEVFEERLSLYKRAKGSVQFPIDQEPPYDLIAEMVRFRAKENRENAAAKENAEKSKSTGARKKGTVKGTSESDRAGNRPARGKASK